MFGSAAICFESLGASRWEPRATTRLMSESFKKVLLVAFVLTTVGNRYIEAICWNGQARDKPIAIST